MARRPAGARARAAARSRKRYSITLVKGSDSRRDADCVYVSPAARSCFVNCPSGLAREPRRVSADTAGGRSCRKKGKAEPERWRKMTAYPPSRKRSTEAAPRLPVEKLSMNRTVLRSSGTVVPPEVTSTMGRSV
eukprot:scaffold247931_cov33-Tisochrysis_lutea.AAC.1